MPKGVGYSGNIQELIDKGARHNFNHLMRHRKHHSEGHMLLMMRMMIEKNMSFKDAHEYAMKQVGK